MRIIRLIIVSIVVLFAIITIISLFIPSTVRISRAVQINASREAVMEQLSDPANWRNWYPDAASCSLVYSNGTVQGLILDASKKQSLVLNSKNDDQVTAVYSMPHKKISMVWQIASSQESNSVTVQWYIEFHLRWYPWEKFASFLFEKVYNPQLQKGLDNLKVLLENGSVSLLSK